MKFCSNCRNDYSITDHNFCPRDGSPLSEYVQSTGENSGEGNRENFKLLLPIRSYVETGKIADSPTAVIDSAQENVFTEPSVAFHLAYSFTKARNAQDLYQSTRSAWKLDIFEARKAKYAFTVYRDQIKEVYEITNWHSAPDDRYEFIGHPAPEFIREKYIGRRLPKLEGRWQVRFFNC